jgi:ATP-binding cassette subfamily B protein
MVRSLNAARPSAGALSSDSRSANMRILKRTAPYLWPKDNPEIRLRIVIAMTFLALAKIATVIAPFFFKAAVNVLAGDTSMSESGLIGLGAVALAIGYGLARIGSNGFQQLRDAVFSKVTHQALRKLARETFEHLHGLSLRYHLERRTGALSRIVDRGVKGIEFVLRFLLFSIAPLVLELLLVAGILYFAFDARFLFVVVITITLYVIFTMRITEWRIKIRRQMNDSDNDASQKAIDSLLNYETVKYFVAEQREAERYDSAMRNYERAAIKTQISLAILNFGQALIVTSGLIALMVLAAIGVQSGEFTVGDFVLVNAYMIQIMLPLGFLGSVYREIRQALIDMSEMFTLLDREHEIRDAADATPLRVTEGHVRFDTVSFAYDPERPILKETTFAASGGKFLAIVGPSGAGKSTIARLLYRFYDIDGGAIRIDGQDIRGVTQNSLRRAIGVVPQDTVLFNDSIAYNIGYAKEGATREEIEAAAKAAQLDGFIESLPDGYNTAVGERGLKLSGGEKQRIGIARAILKNPPILILDEATSALDSRTETEIQKQLRELSKNRTVFAIAHRLSTIAEADEIIVIKDSGIAERGTHSQLLERGGLYAETWHRQATHMDTNMSSMSRPA